MRKKITVISSSVDNKGEFTHTITGSIPFKTGEEYILSNIDWKKKTVLDIIEKAMQLTDTDTREEFQGIKNELCKVWRIWRD